MGPFRSQTVCITRILEASNFYAVLRDDTWALDQQYVFLSWQHIKTSDWGLLTFKVSGKLDNKEIDSNPSYRAPVLTVVGVKFCCRRD
jgi:hypothetical protein